MPEWPGYAVSDDGRVWSCKVPSIRRVAHTPCGKYLRTWSQLRATDFINKQGYRCVHVCLKDRPNKRQRTFSVGVLVALAFIGPRPEGMEVRHFPDPDPGNNHVSNLCYGTHQQNAQDRRVQGTPIAEGVRHGASKLNNTKVLVVRFLARSFSQGFISKLYGISQSVISEIVSRRAWKHVPEEGEESSYE